MNKPEYIILHHSLTKDSDTVSWGAIWKYHTQTMMWSDIGYHFGIELVGNRFEVLLGRMPYTIGAHCKGMNSKSIGVCFVGNYDIEQPPRKMIVKGLELVNWLQGIYKIPIEKVVGHRDFADKTCPGNKFNVERFRNEL